MRVGGEAFTSGAAGTRSVGAVVAELMLAGLGDVRCGAGEEVEGVKCDDLWAIVNRVRAEDFYLGSIAGAGTGVGDGGSEQVADDAFYSLLIISLLLTMMNRHGCPLPELGARQLSLTISITVSKGTSFSS